jgi:3-vinyl bacteriochlorophyllide hydratase
VQLRVVTNRDNPQYGAQSPMAACSPRPISHHRDERLSNNLYSQADESVAAAAKVISPDGCDSFLVRTTPQALRPLYTAEQRRRRDATKWTLVQGVLAPIQFAIFLTSLFLVARYLMTGEGFSVATASIVAKTLLLYTIMITGSIWEREVFGCYLFAPAFFWEDVFSFLVLGLHTAYLVALFAGFGHPRQQMLLALAAYASYFVNASQFILKLRAARRDGHVALSVVASDTGRPA